jgi:hypothetical protein
MVFSILPKNKKKTHYPEPLFLFHRYTQGSEFCSFFGRIEKTINCFQDLLTFSKVFSAVTKTAKSSKWFRLYCPKIYTVAMFNTPPFRCSPVK